jgi:hypothetical protein
MWFSRTLAPQTSLDDYSDRDRDDYDDGRHAP